MAPDRTQCARLRIWSTKTRGMSGCRSRLDSTGHQMLGVVQGVSFDATPPEVRQVTSQPPELGQMSPSPFANSAVVPPTATANGHQRAAAGPQPVR